MTSALPADDGPPCGPAAGLFPETPPRDQYRLDTGSTHVLQVREWGAADGRPLLLLHGGPGSGVSPRLVRTLDPRAWRIIAPDQRGAGLSRPRGALRANDLDGLRADLRRLRRHLGLRDWVAHGGSWGATLALAHALDEPGAVGALWLRAPFLARPADIARFLTPTPQERTGAAWRTLAASVPGGADRQGPALLAPLADALAGEGEAARRVARAWQAWEAERAGQHAGQDADQHADQHADPAPADPATTPEADTALVHRCRVMAHYLRHGCWLQAPDLPARLAALPPRPAFVLQGLADGLCPPEGARTLAAALPGCRLDEVPGAGHDPFHPAMLRALHAQAAELLAHGGGA